MKKTFVLALFPSLILAACGNGVPKVSDPHNIVVDGQKMTQANFLQTYCVGKVGNETCDKVKNAMSRDATKGTVPRF
jgi:hypothetical protein